MKSTFQNGLGWVVVLIATAAFHGLAFAESIESQCRSAVRAEMLGPSCRMPTPHRSATNPETPATFWAILNSLYIPTRLSSALRTVVLRSDSLKSVRDSSTPEAIPWTLSSIPRNALDNLVDRKSTRLNSSHQIISYAVFC